jgi:hypothetical protein
MVERRQHGLTFTHAKAWIVRQLPGHAKGHSLGSPYQRRARQDGRRKKC